MLFRSNLGPNRAWRAPPHPQLCALTQPAMDDLAAKLNMDSYDFFLKNIDFALQGKGPVYAEEMKIAAKEIDWKAKWHPRGAGQKQGTWKHGVGLALQNPVRPARSATVFAGGDDAATAHLRAILKDYPPSSPSIALFQDGKPVYMLHRSDIERRDAYQIAQVLTDAFQKFCATPVAQDSQPVK